MHVPDRARNCKALLLGIAILGILTAGPSRADCGDGGQCRPEFLSIKSAAWVGNRFVVAGQVRGKAGTAFGVLPVAPNGRAMGGLKSIQWPDDLNAGEEVVANPRKIIALPGGEYVVLSQIEYGPDHAQDAWVVKIGANDRVIWNRVLSVEVDEPVSTILHSGSYIPSEDKLVLVGRRTVGPNCEHWSQSLVVGLRGANGQDSQAELSRGAQSPNNRQAIWDIAPGNVPNSFIVTGVIASQHQDRKRCQDDVFLARLTQPKGKWTLTQVGQPLGAKDANEVAFSLRQSGTSYLLAGLGPDAQTKGLAAQAYRVKLNPFGPEQLLTTPLPQAGVAKSGDSAYRAIAALPGKPKVLLAGSRLKGPNQGFWQFVSADLKTAEAPVLINGTVGSDIYDAAPAPAGSLLVVGRWQEEGTSVGWLRLLGEASTASSVPGANVPRRRPDNGLTSLEALSSAGGTYQIKGDPVSPGANYFGRNLAAGAQVDLSFTLASAAQLKITALTEAGDVDLLVADQSKRLVAFSNNRGGAPELLAVSLPAGTYTLSIVAQTKVPSYEVRFASFRTDMAVTTKLSNLPSDQRAAINDVLSAAGYLPASEPAIAFGGETVRALIAVQDAKAIEAGQLNNAIGDALKVR